MLTEEQAKGIKVQLIEQIESSFPEDKKQSAISQIEAMDPEALEAFLVRNGLIKEGQTGQGEGRNCVFCSIVFGDIHSRKIAENSKAMAVLEINPVSRGHVLVIPKEHITFGGGKDIPKEVSELAKNVASTIRSKLKPEKVVIAASTLLGHSIINVIPQYAGEKPGERKPASEEELTDLQRELTKKSAVRRTSGKKRQKKQKTEPREKRQEDKKIPWLPKRIP